MAREGEFGYALRPRAPMSIISTANDLLFGSNQPVLDWRGADAQSEVRRYDEVFRVSLKRAPRWLTCTAILGQNRYPSWWGAISRL
jgi:hypothetical protein